MNHMLNKEEVLVCNFGTDERSLELSNYCFKKMGYNNILVLNSNTGFVDKFLEFAKIASESNYKIFVRSDGDRLVYEIDSLIENFLKDDLDCAEGYGHEHFMNTFRGATPHVFSRKIVEMLNDDNGLMPRVQKPENYFINSLVKKGHAKEKTYKILTNLHEYEQNPSKVCNSFLNRISRGHAGYYDMKYLASLTDFVPAINHAIKVSKKGKKESMDHVDFTFLDSDTKGISEKDIDKTFEKNLQIFKKLNEKFLGV